MLDEMLDEDLSRTYVERLTALTEITSVLEYIVKAILRMQNEVSDLEKELEIRGFVIKEIEDATTSK